MIKAIQLIFEPFATWDKIVLKANSLLKILCLYLIPLLVLSLAGELAGIYHFGKKQEYLDVVKLSNDRIISYGIAHFVLSFVLVFIGAYILKAVTETFRSRNTFTKAFTVIAYGLSPLFMLRLLDAFPSMPAWVTFGIGMVLTIGVFYYGIPKGMEMDPVHAFGVYLMTSMLLAGFCALERFITLLILSGKLKIFSPGLFH